MTLNEYIFSVKLEEKSQINNQSSQLKNRGGKRKSKINPEQVEIIKSINEEKDILYKKLYYSLKDDFKALNEIK